jgi:hypothetical protein
MEDFPTVSSILRTNISTGDLTYIERKKHVYFKSAYIHYFEPNKLIKPKLLLSGDDLAIDIQYFENIENDKLKIIYNNLIINNPINYRTSFLFIPTTKKLELILKNHKDKSRHPILNFNIVAPKLKKIILRFEHKYGYNLGIANLDNLEYVLKYCIELEKIIIYDIGNEKHHIKIPTGTLSEIQITNILSQVAGLN